MVRMGEFESTVAGVKGPCPRPTRRHPHIPIGRQANHNCLNEYILPNSATPREGVFFVANSPEGERKEVIKKKNISRLYDYTYALPTKLHPQVKKIGIEPMTLSSQKIKIGIAVRAFLYFL